MKKKDLTLQNPLDKAMSICTTYLPFMQTHKEKGKWYYFAYCKI